MQQQHLSQLHNAYNDLTLTFISKFTAFSAAMLPIVHLQDQPQTASNDANDDHNRENTRASPVLGGDRLAIGSWVRIRVGACIWVAFGCSTGLCGKRCHAIGNESRADYAECLHL